eukprot:1112646-Prymnesium_polylepis.1
MHAPVLEEVFAVGGREARAVRPILAAPVVAKLREPQYAPVAGGDDVEERLTRQEVGLERQAARIHHMMPP